MRLLAVLLLLAFCVLMSGACSGCTKTFPRLNRHQDNCKPYQDLLNGGLKRRADDGRAEREAEVKRQKEKRALEAERLQRVAEERAEAEVCATVALAQLTCPTENRLQEKLPCP